MAVGMSWGLALARKAGECPVLCLLCMDSAVPDKSGIKVIA